MKIQVEKRDKKMEDYDPEKIVKVVKETGLGENEAKKLSTKISNWLKQNKFSRVTSLQIRDRVLIEIQKIDVDAAKKFIWYEKYKDKNYGVKY